MVFNLSLPFASHPTNTYIPPLMNTTPINTLQLVSVRWWNASAYYGISLADALMQQGENCTVGGRVDSPPIVKAGNVFQLPIFDEINLESLSPLSAIKNLRSLKSFIHKNRISLINAHRPEDHSFAAILNALSSERIPVVRTVSDVRAPKDRSLNKLLHDKATDFYIFSCKASYDRYQAVWPIFEQRSKVIYSAIDTDKYQPLKTTSPLREKFGVANDELLFGMIARLSPVKDHSTFLKAAAKVLMKYPKLKFLIAGEEVEISFDTLKTLARELDISNQVIFLPRDDTIDHTSLVGALDAGIIASTGSEVICRIAVEYMSMGVPQIVTDVNVLPEIIDDGKNGLVIPHSNPDALAASMYNLAEKPALRKEMVVSARQAALSRFSYPVLAKETLAVYRQILAEKSGRQ